MVRHDLSYLVIVCSWFGWLSNMTLHGRGALLGDMLKQFHGKTSGAMVTSQPSYPKTSETHTRLQIDLHPLVESQVLK